MKNRADYSKYKCPYSHIEKECGHELHGPDWYENTYGVLCACGYRGPVFCLDPDELRLELKCDVCTGDGIAANEDGWCKCENCNGTGYKL